MRVARDDLQKYSRTLAPSPPPIEPVLTPAEEAELIARGTGHDPDTAARRARVLAILHRPATPEGTDAALIALLAAAEALPLENDQDRVKARKRLAEIGRMKNPPPEVLDLCRRLRIAPGESAAFAEALLPARHDGTSFYESGAGFLSGPG